MLFLAWSDTDVLFVFSLLYALSPMLYAILRLARPRPIRAEHARSMSIVPGRLISVKPMPVLHERPLLLGTRA